MRCQVNITTVPFRKDWQELVAIGSGTDTFIPSGYGITQLPMDSCVSFNVPAGVNNGAMLMVPFYGSVFGFQVFRTATASYPPNELSCLVDGRAYKVRATSEMMASRTYSGHTDMRGAAVVVDDLPNLPEGRPHYAYITCVSHPTLATSNLFITSLLLDGLYYPEPPVDTYVKTPFVPINAAVGLFSDSASSAAGTGQTMLRTISKIVLKNLDSTAHTVSFKVGNDVIDAFELGESGLPTARKELDFNNMHSGVLSWLCDGSTANVVRATVYGKG